MSEHGFENQLRSRRKDARLSQTALAAQVGVSRQAILAIEAGRNIPSTRLALRIAYSLGCGIEEIFRLTADSGITARLAPSGPGLAPAGPGDAGGSRVALGRIGERWIAHRLPAHANSAADGIVTSEGSGGDVVVRPLGTTTQLRQNVLVAGCAPLLGALADRVDRRFRDARVTWLSAGNRRALELLGAGLVHIAGLHRSSDDPGGDTVAAARSALPDRRLLVANLTRWRQGLVVRAGNPLGITCGADLLREGLRVVRREAGSGAHDLAARLAAEAGGGAPDDGPLAANHREVARLVNWGAADVGIAIEAAALAEGLAFVPLTEERFDLVLPADGTSRPPVSRLLETLDDPDFRAEMKHLPGYDGSLSGQVTTVEAA